MSLFDRLFPGRGTAAEAKRAESRGDLAHAIELCVEAREPEEAARLMILRGDSETDPRLRLQFYAQAATTATLGTPFQRQARAKRASLRLALATDAPVSATTRRDLLEAAKELEELGETDRAAEAYALLHDTEGQARALVQGGQVEELETLLASEQSKADEDRRRHQAHAEVETLILTGRRREALAQAELLGASARERIDLLRSRRVAGGICRLLVLAQPITLLLDDEVVIGRTEGSLVVRSAALSRKHLAIAKKGGVAVVRDLGSRNGTLLRGMRIAGALPVGEGLELQLGGEVDMKMSPVLNGLEVRMGGERYLAPLGPFHLGIESWRVERASDGWVELVTEAGAPAYRADMALAARTTLLVGDRFAQARGGEVVLEIVG
jgi:hypothetical protein